jgi:beta-phosphoglucomutase-like phosphatase (HAD superfamily)
MDGVVQLLELARQQGWQRTHLRGLWHLAIGRALHDAQGRLLSPGSTWRELANILKQLKYDRDLVLTLGLDPESLLAKDRDKFWYYAIAATKLDTPEARQQADELKAQLAPLGIIVGSSTHEPGTINSTPAAEATAEAEKKPKKKKS